MGDLNSVFVGCDVGDKTSEICVLNAEGAVVERKCAPTTLRGLVNSLAKYGRALVVVEVGTHSRWISQALTASGHRVIVANARQVRLIWKNRKKTDKADAYLLARLARFDVSLLAPVQHRSQAAQVDLAALRSRDALVRARVHLINHVRGMLKPNGIKATTCSTSAFAERVTEQVPAELVPALGPVLKVLGELNAQIAAQDKQIEQLAAACPIATRLSQIGSVGALTALAYRLTLEDPTRFKKSRVVASFVGLTPAKDQSGQRDPQKRISKAGDPFLRRLLVQCAHHLLGWQGRDCDIRRWGLGLAERGGKAGKKRAVVAVARKLAVVMHRVWVSGDAYQPFRDHAPQSA